VRGYCADEQTVVRKFRGCSGDSARELQHEHRAGVNPDPAANRECRDLGCSSGRTATVPVAALQAMVQALGGPVTITMTDVAPKDFSSLLPAGTVVDTNSVEVIQFSAQRSGASLAVETPGTVLGQIASPNLRFSFRFTPYGYTCGSAVTATVTRAVFPFVGAEAPLENLVISSGNPQVISVDVGVPSSIVSRFFVSFKCDKKPVFVVFTGAR
jgi:hypothetical protein